jgi:large subunit ribosomal protein L31
MRTDIHPTYYPDAKVICACGNTWTTGSTIKEIKTEMCSACHPFYTGEQRIVDSEGQVDRFYKRLKAHQYHVDDVKTREAERTSPERPVADLDLSGRATQALADAGVTNVGQALAKLEKGDAALLSIDGFGQKSLADLKKALRRFGYPIPEEVAELAA